MDIKQIHELVKLVNKSNIGELSIEKNDFKITIKQKKDPMINYGNVPQQAISYIPQPAALPPQQIENKTEDKSKDDNLLIVKSPMIGTFYRQAGPGKPIFVNVGDEITVGKVVCIIEAMKLFNEIESEIAGKIVKVLVDDASPVEFDQPLFLVEPN